MVLTQNTYLSSLRLWVLFVRKVSCDVRLLVARCFNSYQSVVTIKSSAL